jgi:hypothetical protein
MTVIFQLLPGDSYHITTPGASVDLGGRYRANSAVTKATDDTICRRLMVNFVQLLPQPVQMNE